VGIERDLLVSFDVDVNTAIETLVVEAVLGTGVEAVLTALFETVLAAGVAAVVLVNADFLFSADASGTATVFLSGGDADVLADALLVTGRAGLLGLRLLLLFPSSALDCYLLLSLDLFGLLVVSVGRRKDAERDSGRLLVDVFGGALWMWVVRHCSFSSYIQCASSPTCLAGCILTGFWRRNPAWRLEGDSSTLQDSNATCKADKADKRRGRGFLSAVSDECQRVAVCELQSGTNGGCR
jgi:hypothetical protein